MATTAVDRDILCIPCTEFYGPEQIDVYLDEERVTTLEALETGREPELAQPRATRMAKAFLGGGRRPARRSSSGVTIETARPYEFRCPQGHLVDGNRGRQILLAFVGPSGSSKSHILPGVVRELGDMSSLAPVGIALSESLYSYSKLTDDAKDIYRRFQRLDPTQNDGGLLGPYPHRLTIDARPGAMEIDEYTLLLVDVAGEAFANIMTVVQDARFVLMSSAVIVLLDPQNFLPSAFDDAVVASQRRRIDAAADVRQNIRTIIGSLAETRRTPAAKLNIPFCFVVAKADAVEWPDQFAWEQQTTVVTRAVSDGETMRTALQRASDGTREALRAAGGDLVIAEIERNLDDRYVRYVAASATSVMPAPKESGNDWLGEPTPEGIGLTVLHSLDMAGLTADPVENDE